nr:hypothetical protein [Tanacetum cinerariifolium]
EFPQIDYSLADLMFKQGDNPDDAINKMMSFCLLSATVQPVHGRQSLFAAGTSGTRAKILKIGSGKVLNEEELEFLADPGVTKGPVTQTIITHNETYQADDLDAYDSDCDNFSTTKAVLMANLSSYESYVLSKIDYSLADLMFKQGDNPDDAINKMMSFCLLSATVQPVHGRQSLFAAGTSGTRAKILKTGSGKVLNEEELEFLADPGVTKGPVTQTIITHNETYQADDLDAYDSDCDNFSTTKAVLMANLSSYESYVLSK